MSFACAAQSKEVRDHHSRVESEMLNDLGVADYTAPASLLAIL